MKVALFLAAVMHLFIAPDLAAALAIADNPIPADAEGFYIYNVSLPSIGLMPAMSQSIVC